jgi:ankyrin repeat protein
MDARFHPAQAALAAGDVDRLASLLVEDPGLATARSSKSHPTLLQCLVLTMPPADTLETLIEMLAAHGAELTEPFVAASGMENLRAMMKLLDLGARIDGSGRWSPLEEALYFGNGESVKLLLERGAAVHNLRTAAGLGDMDWMSRCFDEAGELTPAAGAIAWPFGDTISEDVRHDRQQTLDNALVYAASWGQNEAVDFLLARGAGLNHTPAGFDYAGTALHYAALCGRDATADRLLLLGADPGITDLKIGKLPEDWADHGGHKELAGRLKLARIAAV